MTIAAIVLLKEEELLAQFRAHGALSLATAKTPGALGISDDGMFRRLLGRAVVREGAPGTYYLDEAVVAESREKSRRLRPVLVVIAVVLAVLAIALVARMTGSTST